MKIEKILLIILYLSLGLLILYLAKNKGDVDAKLEESAELIMNLENVASTDIAVVSGGEVYVPAYSNIKSFDGKSMLNLSINLSIRNTDPDHAIVLSYVDFYDTKGKISKKYIDQPISVGPMATIDFHITQSDPIGGSGANFYIKWIADTEVNEPVIEAIMLGSSGTQGYSWSSKGLVVKQIK